MSQGKVQFQVPTMGPVVKILLIVSVAVFLLQLTVESLTNVSLSPYFGFVPLQLLHGWIWQPFTYAFLHGGVFHLLFNLLILWSLGSELEQIWGAKFFLFYFFSCTVGAAITYAFFSAIGIGAGPQNPVIGSSGAVYGLLLAYGILFGERVLYFFMIFPMKAKYFVMILGGIVLISTVFYSSGGVAHTAHLGGMIVGMAILVGVTVWRKRQRQGKLQNEERKARLKQAKHLRLVTEEEEEENPKVWH